MLVNGTPYRTVWMDQSVIKLIDQTLLPHTFKIITLTTPKEVKKAIQTMQIRGAPAIGAIAAYGLAQAAITYTGYDYQAFLKHLDQTKTLLATSRPTAHDLFHGLETVWTALTMTNQLITAQTKALEAAETYAETSIAACKAIGTHGATLIKPNMGILTHCNAGALATVDYGTALAPFRMANVPFFVYVDETRPRNQGSLTAFELAQEGIPHAIIADNAAGHYMQQGNIQMVITGTDRVAANGDVANKIGTYTKAVLAKVHAIPFYVAAPTSTIDFSCPTGKDIPIEERDEDEIHYVHGQTAQGRTTIRVTPPNSKAYNPAFDVTPYTYVTGLITEFGIFEANSESIRNIKALLTTRQH